MPRFYFGFGLLADSNIVSDGVYIDNIFLTKEGIVITGHGFDSFDGTSMAAPHVSGVAGLVLSVNPDLSFFTLKSILLNSVDIKPSLSGKTLTGGRVNAFRAVNSATFSFSINEGTVGSVITLTGYNFGNEKGKVFIGNARVKILGWSDSAIQFEITKPQSAGIYPLRIERKQAKYPSPLILNSAFTMKAPRIKTLLPNHGPGGSEVTIQGLFFGKRKGTVLIGGIPCKIKTWSMNPLTGEGSISFIVPEGLSKGPYDLTVTNKVGSETKAGGFTIE